MKTIYTESELAKELQISQWTVRSWRLKLGLPHFRTAGKIFYRKETVDKWLDELEAKSQINKQNNENPIRQITV